MLDRVLVELDEERWCRTRPRSSLPLSARSCLSPHHAHALSCAQSAPTMTATTPRVYPPPGPLGQTDPARWRLSSATDGGRHVWLYHRDPDSTTAAPYETVWGTDDHGVRDKPQTDEAAYWLGLDLPLKGVDPAPARSPLDAAKKGAPTSLLASLRRALTRSTHRLRVLQAPPVGRRALERRVRRCASPLAPSPAPQADLEAHTGPMFLLPGIIIALYVTKSPIPEEWRVEIARYLANLQRKGGDDDQGWGMCVFSLTTRRLSLH